MTRTLYYCVLKNYKGRFIKVHRGNTHLFLIPVSDDEYLYLGLIGGMVGEENRYATQLIVRIPSEIIIPFINHEIKYFGGRFEVVSKVKAEGVKKEAGKYEVNVLAPSYYIKSDLNLTYELEYSTPNRRIYVLDGQLKFMAGTVNPKTTMSMAAMKQQALLKTKKPGHFLSKKDLVTATKKLDGVEEQGLIADIERSEIVHDIEHTLTHKLANKLKKRYEERGND